MPDWTGWCYAPDSVEGVAPEGGNGGWYYKVPARVQTLPHIAVVGNHISLVGAQANLAHVTWELKAFDDDNQWYDPDSAFDVKLYHWFSVDAATGTYSINTRDNEYGSNYDRLVERYDGLPDDIVDADNELTPYSNELMSGFMDAFVAANRQSEDEGSESDAEEENR